MLPGWSNQEKSKLPWYFKANRMQSKLPIIEKIETWIGTKRFHSILDWANKTTLPGFGESLFMIWWCFLYHESRRSIMNRVNSMAYTFYSLYSHSLSSCLPWFRFYPSRDLKLHYSKNYNNSYSGRGSTFFGWTLEDVIWSPYGVVVYIFLTALYFSTNAIHTMMRGFEKYHPSTFFKEIFSKRDWMFYDWFLVLLVITSVVILIFRNEIWNFLVNYFSKKKIVIVKNDLVIRFLFLKNIQPWCLPFFRWAISIILFQCIYFLIYRYGPSVKESLIFLHPALQWRH